MDKYTHYKSFTVEFNWDAFTGLSEDAFNYFMRHLKTYMSKTGYGFEEFKIIKKVESHPTNIAQKIRDEIDRFTKGCYEINDCNHAREYATVHIGGSMDGFRVLADELEGKKND